MHAYRLLVCVPAVILLGCGERSQRIQLASPSIAVGETAVVKFARPLDAAGHQYWITLVEASQPDSQWGAWQYVDRTAREITLAAATTPGLYEVRLHDQYPAKPHHVVARAALTVTGSATTLSPSTTLADSQPAPVTAVAAAPVTVASPVPEADVAAMAAIDYGSPSTRFESVLHVKGWAKDGGGQEIVSPSSGHRFLVVEFPHTATQSGQIFYDSRQVFLRIGGDMLQPYAVTTGGASAPSSSRTPDGRRVFQREVWVSHYAPAPDLPFAMAFQIPASATGCKLQLGRRESTLSW